MNGVRPEETGVRKVGHFSTAVRQNGLTWKKDEFGVCDLDYVVRYGNRVLLIEEKAGLADECRLTPFQQYLYHDIGRSLELDPQWVYCGAWVYRFTGDIKKGFTPLSLRNLESQYEFKMTNESFEKFIRFDFSFLSEFTMPCRLKRHFN